MNLLRKIITLVIGRLLWLKRFVRHAMKYLFIKGRSDYYKYIKIISEFT